MDGEVVVARRRQWTPEEKAALMAEVDAEGGRVSVVARRHGISKSLLYNWRSAWKAAAARPAAPTPAGICSARRRRRRIRPELAGANDGRCRVPRGTGLALAERAGVIEIDLPDGVRVRVDSSVNEKALRRVLSALRGAG